MAKNVFAKLGIRPFFRLEVIFFHDENEKDLEEAVKRHAPCNWHLWPSFWTYRTVQGSIKVAILYSFIPPKE